MPKGTDIHQLATKVIAGDKEAEKDLMLALPEGGAYDDKGKLMLPLDIAKRLKAEQAKKEPQHGATLIPMNYGKE